ncbi:hypothetical protein E1B28_008845 [Marasmius oreades]|uniref:Uncharacterized protein n=1 Tax=Marasmius oreades TaxID=181124 RepID=A0A9P7UUP7_9AGAR|nr:uncharacterized protein E1B28_008845 [Marasmius oreades]KAG7092494.1 hypothetical protein E1B28_008845 [Marasmius oreades]
MMKLSTLLPLLALPFAWAASTDNTRQELINLASVNGIIRLDHKAFDLLTSPKRNWSAAIQFTALDRRRRCAPCKEFEPSWNAVAQSWKSAPKEHRDNHFFATLDFDEAPTVFQQLGLMSAPVVYVYPSVQGPHAPTTEKTGPSKYDFSYGLGAGPLAESLSNHTPIPIPYKEPLDWARLVSFASVLLGLAIIVRFISPLLQSRWTWAAITIITMLVMTGGYMFTRIRGSPYTGGDGNWIAGGYQNQFGQEVQVVAVIYGTLSFAFLMLILIVPYQSSPSRQRLQIYLWTGVIVLVYSVLITLFKVKNRGYPFRLLL